MDLFQSLAGVVELELTSADTASALAAIADAGISMRNVNQTDDVTVRFCVLRTHYPPLKKITEKRGEALSVVTRYGFYWYLKRGFTRPVLLCGMFLLLSLVGYLPSRVLFVQVEGNNTVPAKRILEAAENCGIAFGASRREVRSERVKNALLHAVPELQWAGVNTYGCVAVISVRERSETPQEKEKTGVCSIVAVRDGIITSCTATNGNLLCYPGQAVRAGEVLISGYTDCGITIQATRAEGEIYAQTVRQLQVISPSDYIQTAKVSKHKHCFSLIIGKKRIILWKDSGISDTICDRIYEEYYVTLPGDFSLPFALAVDRYELCGIEPQLRLDENQENRISTFASDYIGEQMIAGEVNARDVTFTQEEGFLRLEGKYICTEMIGKVQWEQIGEYNGESG